MAYYQSLTYLNQFAHSMFDTDWLPGQVPTYHGVYRCKGCGKNAAVNERIPPQNHHQHTPSQGAVVWRLIVWAHAA
jgi:hypothetical protein